MRKCRSLAKLEFFALAGQQECYMLKWVQQLVTGAGVSEQQGAVFARELPGDRS